MSGTAIRVALKRIAMTPILRPSAKIVLIVLADCHNQETGRCDPSVATIARRGAMSMRAAQEGIAQLAELRIIQVVYRQEKTGKGRKNMTSRYKISGLSSGAKSASTLVQNLHPNLKYRPSAFDDLAMSIEDWDELPPAGMDG